MWREVWDDTVSQIYRDTLSKSTTLLIRGARIYTDFFRNFAEKEEPVFGRSPKPDPYAEVKQAKKYL